MRTNYFEQMRNEMVVSDHDELMKILGDRAKTDKWYMPKISQCRVVGFTRANNEETPLQDFGLNDPAEDWGYSMIQNEGAAIERDLMGLSNLFILFPDENENKVAYPLYISGLRCTADRMGEAGRTFWDKLSPEKKAERLCEDAMFYHKECKILVRDNMVIGNHSAGYVILPELELVHAMEDALKAEHPDMEFKKGEISLEFLHCWYDLNDEDNEECFKLIMNDHGIDTMGEPVKCGIEFFTSDSASSSAAVFPYFSIRGVRARIGDGIRLDHDGLSSISKWKKRLPEVDGLFKEAEDRIEDMGNTPIKNVKNTVFNLTEKYATKFPKRTVKEMSDNFLDGPGTAIDVYLTLCEIMDEHCTINHITGMRKLNLTAEVSKFLFRNYTEFDI